MTQGKGHPDDRWVQITDAELTRPILPYQVSEERSVALREFIEAHKEEIRKAFNQQVYEAVRRVNAETKLQEAWVEALEKRADVEKRLRKFKPPDPAEPGIAKWFAVPIAQIFLSEDQREEWLGDLREENRRLMRDGYPDWMLNLISIGKIARLLKSSIAIKIVDFILKLRGKV